MLSCMGRDELKAEHKPSRVACAPDSEAADRTGTVKAVLFHALGITARPCDLASARGAA